MTKRLLPFAFACLAALLLTGCVFSRRSKPKESPALARETEQEFRQRWVDRRTTELTAAGTAATAARAQAEGEFADKYGFTTAAHK